MHFGCGAWGVLAVGFFATEASRPLADRDAGWVGAGREKRRAEARPDVAPPPGPPAPLQTSTRLTYGYANDWGVFYGGSGKQLGMQLLGLVIIAAWSCTLAGVVFWTLRRIGWLRVDKEAEQQGLDITQVSGRAGGRMIGRAGWWAFLGQL